MLIRNSEFTDADPDGQFNYGSTGSGSTTLAQIRVAAQTWQRAIPGLGPAVTVCWSPIVDVRPVSEPGYRRRMWDLYPRQLVKGGRKLQKFVAVCPIWRLEHKPYIKNLATLRLTKVMLKTKNTPKKRNTISGSVKSLVLYQVLDMNNMMNPD